MVYQYIAQVRHLCHFATLVSAQANLCDPPETLGCTKRLGSYKLARFSFANRLQSFANDVYNRLQFLQAVDEIIVGNIASTVESAINTAAIAVYVDNTDYFESKYDDDDRNFRGGMVNDINFDEFNKMSVEEIMFNLVLYLEDLSNFEKMCKNDCI